MKTRNFADVIRRMIAEDPQLAADVQEAMKLATELEGAYAEGVAAERERCAKLAESWCCCIDAYKNRGLYDPQCQAHDIAGDIREEPQP